MAEDFKEWIEKLKTRTDIVSVISRYVNVVQRGSNYWACCPFHHETIPSFCINPITNSYYCYGACKEGGDAISFIQKIEKTDFMGAIKILAAYANMEVPSFKGENGEDTALRKKHKDKLYSLMKDAAKYYYSVLRSDEGLKAREYLKNRGITDSTIIHFGMGYSATSTGCPKYLASLGYSLTEMQEVGIVSKNSTKGYDLFNERIIVPIFNGTKQIVGFGGRIIVKKDNVGKYFNTSETILFNKRFELFGQHSVKKLQMEENVNSIVIVEGYMDAISLYQAGVKNVMATMGTALTTQQARILKRYCNNIYLCYDGDEAGQKGSYRGVDRLLEEGLSVKVVVLPDGQDPDEYIQRYGTDNFLKLVSSGYSANEFKLRYMAKEYDLNDDTQMEEYAKKAVDFIATLTPIQLENAIPIVCKLTKLPESVIRGQLFHDKKIDIKAIRKLENTRERKNNSYYLAARFILFTLYDRTPGCQTSENLSIYFQDPLHVELYDYIKKCEALGEDYSLNTLMNIGDNVEANEVEKASRDVTEDMYTRYYNDCVTRIKKLWRQKQLVELSKDCDTAQTDLERLETLSRIIQAKNDDK